jgi:hypothetical protein
MGPEEIVALAEREGVELTLAYGRLRYRGSSPRLTELLKTREGQVVEHLFGRGSFNSPLNRAPNTTTSVYRQTQ